MSFMIYILKHFFLLSIMKLYVGITYFYGGGYNMLLVGDINNCDLIE